MDETPALRRAVADDAAAVRVLTREAYAKWVPVIGREPLPMRADSILLHGDAPGALDLAKALRKQVETAGWMITPVSQLHK